MERDKIHISGSEVAAILGLSKYDSPIDIYMRKLGLLEPKPESEPMRWGTAAEHVVARRYAKQSGHDLFPSVDIGYDRLTPLVHPKYPWWTGTPDRKILAVPPPDIFGEGLLEIKIIGEHSAADFGEPPDGEVPDSYLCQMAWYFPLLGVEWGDLAVQVGNRDFRIYRIKRDQELENQMRDAALDFIENHLIPEVPPEIDGSDSSRAYLNFKYPQEKGPILEPTDAEILKLIRDYAFQRGHMKLHEADLAEMENRLKEFVGDAAGMQGEWGKITWKKTKDSQKVNWEGLAMSLNPNPQQMQTFTTPKPGIRRWLPKFNEED